MTGPWTITVDRKGDMVDDGTVQRGDRSVLVVPCDDDGCHGPSYAAGFDEGWRTAAAPDLGHRVVPRSVAEALAAALGAFYEPAHPHSAARFLHAKRVLAEYRAKYPKETP